MSNVKTIVILSLIAACGGWSKKDTALELGFAGATALDWHQTETIVYNCNETNPIIGQCGQNMSPDLFMPLAIAAHALVAIALPPKWRTIWQSLGIGAEVSTVWENYSGKYWVPPIVVEGGHEVAYSHGETK